MKRRLFERKIFMKKLWSAILAVVLALSLTACAGNGNGNNSPKFDGDINSLLSQVTEGVTDPEMSLVSPEITDENFSWYFFIDPIEGADAAVSEPVIGSIPHFIGLLRVPEGTDAETVRTDIEKNLDPRKWVCTEAEKTAVVLRGNLILVAMSDRDTVAKATANFNAL